MRPFEHKAVGDTATGEAPVDLGGDPPDEPFWLTFGDVTALSGDFFGPGGSLDGASAAVVGDPHVTVSDALFDLARVPGASGTRLGTRDEIVCALKVAKVDDGVVDRRFDPGGRFSDFDFNPRAERSDVERQVRDRYLALAAVNDDHFVAPGRSDVPTGSGFGSAPSAYRHLHQAALAHAWTLGRQRGDVSRAMAREAAAQHYLTDACAAGHLRTPVASIRRFWKARHPGFWEHLQRRVASDTAKALRELSRTMRVLPARYLQQRALSELTARTRRYPELSLGDLIARCLHDWDNSHGLRVEGGGLVFGDGQTHEGRTTDLALAAVRAGVNDVEVAFELGVSGRDLSLPALYQAVRDATGAGGAEFVAETQIPVLTADNPPQNWRATNAQELWTTPIVGASGTTVGEALEAMLEPTGLFIRQLDCLGVGLSGSHGPFAVPVLGGWLTATCCHAFHAGFLDPFAHDPKPVLLALAGEPSSETAA